MSNPMRFICLANSRKLSARCVAGIRLVEGRARRADWVRPVTAGSSGEVPIPIHDGGEELRLGDVIEFTAGVKVAHAYQPENVLLDSPSWRKHGRMRWSVLEQLAEPAEEPWPSGGGSSLGLFDRFPESEGGSVRRSLSLQRVRGLQVAAARNPWSGKVQVRATFELGGRTLRLSVTDPVATARLTRDGASMELADALVCLSLSEPYDGYIYKLVAGILDPAEYVPR